MCVDWFPVRRNDPPIVDSISQRSVERKSLLVNARCLCRAEVKIALETLSHLSVWKTISVPNFSTMKADGAAALWASIKQPCVVMDAHCGECEAPSSSKIRLLILGKAPRAELKS